MIKIFLLSEEEFDLIRKSMFFKLKHIKFTEQYKKNHISECKKMQLDLIYSKYNKSYVFELNEKPIGCVIVSVPEDSNNKWNEYKWINNLYVDPKYRGNGIGEYICKYAMKNLGGNALAVKRDNKIAINLYKKLGFKIEKNPPKNEKYILMYLHEIITENFNYDLLNEEEQFITSYKAKMKRLSSETNETRIARLTVNKLDKSSYQKFQRNDNPKNKINILPLINEDTYLTSDIHFGREIYNDKDTIKRLNKIPENSILIILGDLGYVKTSCREYIKECFKQLTCKNIFLVLGNHDCYELDFYYKELGIKGVYERITLDKRKWVFSHQPCDGPSNDYINFHGHIHEENNYIQVTSVDTKINVFYKYFDRPQKIKELIEWNKNNNLEKRIIS